MMMMMTCSIGIQYSMSGTRRWRETNKVSVPAKKSADKFGKSEHNTKCKEEKRVKK